MNNNIPAKLLELAYKSKESAYAPYSKFRVGAALMTKNNNYYVGCNIENISYRLTICAEAAAIAAMVTAGEKEIQDLVVVSDLTTACFPCGACRQTIQEFSSPQTKIYLLHADKRYFTINELLPFAFDSLHKSS